MAEAYFEKDNVQDPEKYMADFVKYIDPSVVLLLDEEPLLKKAIHTDFVPLLASSKETQERAVEQMNKLLDLVCLPVSQNRVSFQFHRRLRIIYDMLTDDTKRKRQRMSDDESSSSFEHVLFRDPVDDKSLLGPIMSRDPVHTEDDRHLSRNSIKPLPAFGQIAVTDTERLAFVSAVSAFVSAFPATASAESVLLAASLRYAAETQLRYVAYRLDDGGSAFPKN